MKSLFSPDGFLIMKLMQRKHQDLQSHNIAELQSRHLMHSHMELYVEFKSSKMNIEAESKDTDGDGHPAGEARNKSVIWEYYTKTSRGTVMCNREDTIQFCRELLGIHLK